MHCESSSALWIEAPFNMWGSIAGDGDGRGILKLGKGEVRVYRGTGVSRGVRRTTWERSLKIWELQISCFEEFLGGENVLGLVPASLPHNLGYACTFYAPTSPPPKNGTLKSATAPKRVLSNPQEGSIEPLKRFHRTPFWAPKRFYRTLVRGLQNHGQGSIEPFASNPPFLGYPFKILPRWREPLGMSVEPHASCFGGLNQKQQLLPSLSCRSVSVYLPACLQPVFLPALLFHVRVRSLEQLV